METTISEKKESTIKEGKKGGRKWGSLIFKFLMYGGWLLVVVIIIAIVALISILGK
jgi:uncharacterized membrane protein YccF (DUF307 family)